MEQDELAAELDDQELGEALDEAMVELTDDLEAFNTLLVNASVKGGTLDRNKLFLLSVDVMMNTLVLKAWRVEAVARGLKVAEWDNQARAEEITQWSKATVTDLRIRMDSEFLSGMGISGGLAPEE